MTTTEETNLEIARRFVRAVESGATGDTLAAFWHEDAVHHELPTRLFPEGVKRDRASLLASAEKGKKVLAAQRYEVLHAVSQGDRVALEIDWRGTLAVPLGSLRPGDEMHARCAMFLELYDGRIVSARNYDCYDPF